jgi:hypothetical protein
MDTASTTDYIVRRSIPGFVPAEAAPGGGSTYRRNRANLSSLQTQQLIKSCIFSEKLRNQKMQKLIFQEISLPKFDFFIFLL